jgi:hypothetical protein
VLDVLDLESGEASGVTAYKCDVGDSKQVAKVAAQIEKEVREAPRPIPPCSAHLCV